jgi:excisionase family DNA binding protein
VSLSALPLTLTVEQAAKVLGVSRGLAYQAAAAGELPTIKLGRRLLVPRARLLAMLGEPVNDEGRPAGGPREISHEPA